MGWDSFPDGESLLMKEDKNGQNKLFSYENKVPRRLFAAREVAGSATYKQSKWYESDFIQFIHSWDWREFVYSVCSAIKKSVNEDIKCLPPKLHSAPLTSTANKREGG